MSPIEVVGLVLAVAVAVACAVLAWRFPRFRWPLLGICVGILGIVGFRVFAAALADRVKREQDRAETSRRLVQAREARVELARHAQDVLDDAREREGQIHGEAQGEREAVRRAGRTPTDVGT